VFDCKNGECQKIYHDAPTIIDSLGEKSQKEWKQLQNFLSELSVSFVYNPRLVRGLDYYNKTVFEFASPDLGAQSAFCGGGRYDQLVAEIGGKQDQPAIGAAIGIDRLCMLLEMNQDNLPISEQPALTVIIPFAEEQHSIGLQLNKQLSSAGKCTQMLSSGSVKSMMKRANKLGAKHCILIGDQEQQDGTVLLKNMITGEEQNVRQFDVLSLL
jgi:histidyl-tRNA synthetase